tara:strand:+ start:189 stop:434 length:246 start_codon:yes stop_codon:yes gene_type:complete
MAGPFKMKGMSFGNSPMHQDKAQKISKSRRKQPTDREIAAIKLHNVNLKDYAKEYSSSYYDERKANNAKILKKYPNYNWDK